MAVLFGFLPKRKTCKVNLVRKSGRGIFSNRAPKRPNPIGISIVRFLKIEENILKVEDVDIVDGTPLLNIKPYVPEFDIRKVEKIGWLRKNIHKLPSQRDDRRFIE